MIYEDLYFGHPHAYWIELQKRAAILNASSLLQEVVTLRGRLAFYEERIRQMAEVMGAK